MEHLDLEWLGHGRTERIEKAAEMEGVAFDGAFRRKLKKQLLNIY